MSRRVRRRAISKCKGVDSNLRWHWKWHIEDGKANQTPKYMLDYNNWIQFMANVGNKLAERHQEYKPVTKSRAMGISEMTEEEMIQFNATGTVTSRFKSNEPNIAGTPKTIGGNENE